MRAKRHLHRQDRERTPGPTQSETTPSISFRSDIRTDVYRLQVGPRKLRQRQAWNFEHCCVAGRSRRWRSHFRHAQESRTQSEAREEAKKPSETSSGISRAARGSQV
jgi:hypothetical protein